MRKLSEIMIGTKKVIVRELTVAQVEKQFAEIAIQTEPTTLDWLFSEEYLPEVVLEEIICAPVSTVLTDDMAPSELEPLYKEALKINPFLAGALKQMRRIATLMEGLVIPTEEQVTPDGSDQPPST